MADGSPQVEDGFTRIANELLEVLANTRMPAIGFRVTLWAIRNTYGWRRLHAPFTLYQIARETGIRDDRVGATIKSLMRSNVLAKNEAGEIGVQKQYKLWGRDPERIGPTSGPDTNSGRTSTRCNIGHQLGPKQDTNSVSFTPQLGPISRRAKESKESKESKERGTRGRATPPAQALPKLPGVLWEDTPVNRAKLGHPEFNPILHPDINQTALSLHGLLYAEWKESQVSWYSNNMAREASRRG